MSTNDHTARAESWDEIARWAITDEPPPAADTLLELVGRIKRLEQAQQQGNSSASLTSSAPAPSTPAGQGELVRSVAEAIAAASLGDWTPEARRAILAVADWQSGMGREFSADLLREEVGR